MTVHPLKASAVLLAVAISMLGLAASASAAPSWLITARWGDTNLPPGGKGEFVLLARNIGTSAGLTQPLTISDALPEGVTVTGFDGDLAPFCTGVGTALATCSVPSAQVPALTPPRTGAPPGTYNLYQPSGYLDRVFIDVAIAPSAATSGTNAATISGGGGGAVSDIDQVPFSEVPTSFGPVPGSYEAGLFDAERPAATADNTAGTHPYELRIDFDIAQVGKTDSSTGGLYTYPVGKIRTADVTLPRGVVGNPEATPKCTQADYASEGVSLNSTACPPETQVGLLSIDIGELASDGGASGHGYGAFGDSGGFANVPIYNIEPPKGVPADFGFNVGGFVQGHIYPNLDAARDYAIRSLTPDISDALAVRSAQVTFWGVPGDPSHDSLRVYGDLNAAKSAGATAGAPFHAAIKPLLSLPTDCGVDNGGTLLRIDSWNDPGNFTPIEETSNHLEVEGCGDPRSRFEPKVALQPTSSSAGGPTGLAVHLESPQRDQTVDDAKTLYAKNGNVHGIDTPPIKKAVVILPEGMTLSTSAAQGLGNCSAAQIGLGTASPVTCPASSKYGSLTLHTPILPKDAPMQGDIYIAKQNDNPFHNFLSMYFVIHDVERGLLVKLPGRIDLDHKTGQISATFDDLPQFPVTDMELNMKGGVRAGLVNPGTCGTKTITATFYSWAQPNIPVTRSSSYEVKQKANGSPCVNSLSERPFKPGLSAGTVSNAAGSYSPFVFRLTRSDDEQEFSQLGTTLPPGLLANISGITECPQAAIDQAETPGRTGIAEQLFPSCPASSQIGTTDVGSGVGQVITYIPGKAYLAGPYEGAPLSMIVITPILAGPYDLGVIAVRSAIHVDGATARVSIQTDPFPQIFEGIPVRIRDIRVKADRPGTMINPTNCDPMQVMAHVTGTGGDVNTTVDDTAVDLSDRYQAANCASLGFKPKLTFRLKGGTHRGDFPALQATLRARPGDANIARTKVVLPRSEFIEQGHIRTVCTRVQFVANQCPAGSIYGHASASSPLFDETLVGPVYLRSNGGERLLPDLVVSLNGKINVTLAGFVDSVRGRVRNTFDVVPDAPVTKFTLKLAGGKKGLLVNHLDLCEVHSRAEVQMMGQNGMTYKTHPAMGTSCSLVKKTPKRGGKR